MADFLLHSGAAGMCPHGGPMQIVPSQGKVLVGGQPAATTADQFTITGCAFTTPVPKPQPCVTAKFAPSVKITLSSNPAVLKGGGVVCQSAEQIPQGPPSVTATQIKVAGT